MTPEQTEKLIDRLLCCLRITPGAAEDDIEATVEEATVVLAEQSAEIASLRTRLAEVERDGKESVEAFKRCSGLLFHAEQQLAEAQKEIEWQASLRLEDAERAEAEIGRLTLERDKLLKERDANSKRT